MTIRSFHAVGGGGTSAVSAGLKTAVEIVNTNDVMDGMVENYADTRHEIVMTSTRNGMDEGLTQVDPASALTSNGNGQRMVSSSPQALCQVPLFIVPSLRSILPYLSNKCASTGFSADFEICCG